MLYAPYGANAKHFLLLCYAPLTFQHYMYVLVMPLVPVLETSSDGQSIMFTKLFYGE